MKKITFIAIILISSLKAYSFHNDQVTSNLDDKNSPLEKIIINSGACEVFSKSNDFIQPDSQIESKVTGNPTSVTQDEDNLSAESLIKTGITSRYRSLFWYEGKKIFA